MARRLSAQGRARAGWLAPTIHLGPGAFSGEIEAIPVFAWPRQSIGGDPVGILHLFDTFYDIRALHSALLLL